ncbi:hypothetical protein DRO97_08510 [Archaeoglobales archaeon]|nr:MAG: hypothetical protein DRO97_08510 [Archaeoglobales archaeon]
MIFKKRDPFQKIADEILAASQDVTESIYVILSKIFAEYPGTVYWVCKKLIQDNQGYTKFCLSKRYYPLCPSRNSFNRRYYSNDFYIR